MFMQNAQHTGKSRFSGPISTVTSSASATPVASAGAGFRSPVIAVDGTVYAGGADGKVYAYNSDTTMTTKVGWPVTLGAGSGSVIGTPAIDPNDGSIYVPTTGGFVYALKPDGTNKWAAPFRTALAFDTLFPSPSPGPGVQSGISISPNGAVLYFATFPVVGTVRGVVNPGAVIAVSASTGALFWTSVSFLAPGRFTATPSLSHDGTRLYIGCEDSNFYALDAALGTKVWKYSPSSSSSFQSSAVVSSDDSTVFVGCNDNNVYAFNTAFQGGDNNAAQIKWFYVTSGSVGTSSPALFTDSNALEQVVIANTAGTVYSLYANPTAGMMNVNKQVLATNVVWLYKVQGAFSASANIQASPSVGADGTVYIGGTDASSTNYAPIQLYALKATTIGGSSNGPSPSIGVNAVWSYAVSADNSRPIRGSAAIGANGSVYFGDASTSGKLYRLS